MDKQEPKHNMAANGRMIGFGEGVFGEILNNILDHELPLRKEIKRLDTQHRHILEVLLQTLLAGPAIKDGILEQWLTEVKTSRFHCAFLLRRIVLMMQYKGIHVDIRGTLNTSDLTEDNDGVVLPNELQECYNVFTARVLNLNVCPGLGLDLAKLKEFTILSYL